MAKAVDETVAGALAANIWLAPVGTAEPADFSAAFGVGWFNIGYLVDPPEPSRAVTKTPVLPWNAPEAIRQLLDTEENTITLSPMQANIETFTLYFGPITITDEGTGTRIEPDDTADDPERILCVELIDGSKIFRFFWVRCEVSEVGAMNMPRDGVLSFELTLKRLTPDSGPSWFHQTNLASLASA